MTGAMVFIGRAQMWNSHDTVVGFLRQAGYAIGRVRVRLADASGIAVEERIWSNGTPLRSPKRSPIISPAARASGLI
jgi:hypothetical protein